MGFIDYLSILDLLILGLLGFAGWRGYKRGAYVEGVSFGTIIVGIYLAGRFSEGITNMLSLRANGKDFSYLPVLMFAILFGGLIYLSFNVQNTVGRQVADLEKNKANLVLGSIFGTIHMFLILGVIAIMLKAADYNFQVLPQREHKASFLFKPVFYTMTAVFPALDYVGEVDEEKVKKYNEETDQTQRVIDE